MNGNWNSDNNWGGTQPSSSDKVIFPGNAGTAYTVTINSVEACQRLEVHADCTIQIVTNGRLEVGDCDDQVSQIDGMIVLTQTSPRLRFMFDHTVNPLTSSGSDVFVIDTVSPVSGAAIDRPSSRASTLRIAKNGARRAVIGGVLSIQLSLDNDSKVSAASIELAAGTFTGDGVYTVPGSLRFAAGIDADCMDTNFEIVGGTLYIDEHVCTRGNLTCTLGAIEVAAGKTFRSGATCRNLDDSPCDCRAKWRRRDESAEYC